MAMAIRQANAADAPIVSALNADVQAVHAAALPWRFKPPSAQTFPPAVAAALLAEPGNLLFIAEVDLAPVGYAYAEIVRRPETSSQYAYEMVYLHHVSVRPGYRRHGVGRGLVDKVRSAANDRGIGLLALDVWTFNEEARAFFARCGFTSYNERLWSR
jgi:GNAT superfamily N-acetyltransferase